MRCVLGPEEAPVCAASRLCRAPDSPRLLEVIATFKILPGGLITLLPSAGKGGALGGWSLWDTMVSGGKWPKLHTCQGLIQEGSALFSCLAQILHGGWGWGGGWEASLTILGTTTAGPVLGKA